MANQVDFLPFATSPTANVLDQADYAALSVVGTGFIQGVAQSIILNKVWRQSSFIAAALATLIAEEVNTNVIDNGDLAGFVALLKGALVAIQPRQALTQPRIFYVAPSGSDATGDGSNGNPFGTIQHAFQFVNSTYDFAGQTVTIQLADGTYTQGLTGAGAATGATVATPIIIQGNAAQPANVVVSVTGGDGFVVQNGAGILVKDLTVLASTVASSGGYGVAAVYGGLLMYENLIFGACGAGHCFATQTGQIIAAGNYTISGDAPAHFIVAAGAYGQMSATGGGVNAIQVTLTGTRNFANAFIVVGNGALQAPLNNFTGTATGQRYNVADLGFINTGGQGANYFPGNSAGTPAPGVLGPTGGLYA